MGIRACREQMPNVPMVAVFDTPSFQTLPPKAYMYALPYDLYEKYGIRKYGAHGDFAFATYPSARRSCLTSRCSI